MSIVHACTGLLSPTGFCNKEFWAHFFTSLCDSSGALYPRKYGSTEPLEFAVHPLRPLCFDGCDEELLIWKARHTGTLGIMESGRGVERSGLFISGPLKAFDVSRVKAFYALLQEDLEIDFAYIHLLTSQEIEFYRNSYRSMVWAFNSGLTSRDVDGPLPNLPWAACFGSRYIEKIGRRTILSTSGTDTEKSGNTVWVQVTQNLRDVNDDFEGFDLRREVIKTEIGKEFFVLPAEAAS